jgi:hypothetical protein
VVIDYISSVPELEAFQQMSHSVYEQCIEKITKYTHIRYFRTGMQVLYNRFYNTPMKMPELLPGTVDHILYLGLGDTSAYELLTHASDTFEGRIVLFETSQGLVRRLGPVIPSGFSNAKAIEIGPMPNCTNIDANFMSNLPKLRYIKLDGLSGLEYIDEGFMSDLPLIEHVEFNTQQYLMVIEKNFMANCPNLKTVDMSGLRKKLRLVGKYMFGLLLTEISYQIHGQS